MSVDDPVIDGLSVDRLTVDRLTVDELNGLIARIAAEVGAEAVDTERADMLVDLGGLVWKRYLIVAGRDGGDEQATAGALAAAIRGLRSVYESLGSDIAAGTDVAWWLGLATVDQYTLSGDVDNLEGAIALIQQVIARTCGCAEISAEDEAMVRSLLGQLVLERHEFYPSDDDLDRGIAELAAALRLAAWVPAAARGSEPFWWWDTVLMSARARAERWQSRRLRDDLDAAIECNLLVVGAASLARSTPALLAHLAQLLHDRATLGFAAAEATDAERAEAMRDLADARRWSGQAVDRVGDDDLTRMEVMWAAVTTSLAHCMRTMDVQEWAKLDWLTSQLLLACRQADLPDDAAVAARALVLGLRVSERGLASTLVPARPASAMLDAVQDRRHGTSRRFARTRGRTSRPNT